jgi:hypothetical protein
MDVVDDSKVQNLAWYALNGIKIMSGLKLIEADLEKKQLTFVELKMSRQQDVHKLAATDQVQITVNFDQLCVGTGLQPVLIPGPGPKFGWTVDCMLSPTATESVNAPYGGGGGGDNDSMSIASNDERSVTESEMSESKQNESESVVSISVGKLEVSAPEEYGFGSVHYLSDIGDGTKLIYALSRAEEDGQVKR